MVEWTRPLPDWFGRDAVPDLERRRGSSCDRCAPDEGGQGGLWPAILMLRESATVSQRPEAFLTFTGIAETRSPEQFAASYCSRGRPASSFRASSSHRPPQSATLPARVLIANAMRRVDTADSPAAACSTGGAEPDDPSDPQPGSRRTGYTRLGSRRIRIRYPGRWVTIPPRAATRVDPRRHPKWINPKAPPKPRELGEALQRECAASTSDQPSCTSLLLMSLGPLREYNH